MLVRMKIVEDIGCPRAPAFGYAGFAKGIAPIRLWQFPPQAGEGVIKGIAQ
jgi:hypothetical protein